MKARNLMVCAGLPLCLAVAAASAQQFQTAQAITTQGEQYRMAPLTVVDGQWMLGEFGPWRNHDDQISGRTLGNTPAIDAYEYDYLGDPRTPLGGDLCATTYAPSTRFFLGTTVTNPHYCNDFSLTRPETFGKRVVLFGHTLWWNPPATEPCFIVVRFWDDYNNAGEGTINPTTTGFNVGTGDAILAAKNGLGGFAVELRSSATAPGLTATSAGYRTRYYNFKNEPGIVAYGRHRRHRDDHRQLAQRVHVRHGPEPAPAGRQLRGARPGPAQLHPRDRPRPVDVLVHGQPRQQPEHAAPPGR